jgi:hypothetical protein
MRIRHFRSNASGINNSKCAHICFADITFYFGLVPQLDFNPRLRAGSKLADAFFDPFGKTSRFSSSELALTDRKPIALTAATANTKDRIFFTITLLLLVSRHLDHGFAVTRY